MPSAAKEPRLHSWVYFLGIILLLLGLYASVRTAINLALFDKYPQGGVISLSIFGMPQYYQREQDCFYPQPMFSPDGKSIEPTEEQVQMQKKQQQLCLEGVAESRQTAKVSDISQSVLFLFLGAGLLLARKKYLA